MYLSRYLELLRRGCAWETGIEQAIEVLSLRRSEEMLLRPMPDCLPSRGLRGRSGVGVLMSWSWKRALKHGRVSC